jgi:uncharacterized protein
MSTTSGPAAPPDAPAPEGRGPAWVFLGPEGLRAGWSIALAYVLFYFFRLVLSVLFVSTGVVDDQSQYTAGGMALLELIPFLAMIGAGLLAAQADQRRLIDYNLAGPRPGLHFLFGFAAGFAALSALAGALRLGGWLRFGPVALTGSGALRFGLLWVVTFVLVGCVEEGLFRCYLQFTLTRGLDFRWALGLEVLLCAYAYVYAQSGAGGVYLTALLGLAPCLLLHKKCAGRSGFWQAAWVTSTLFGLIHTYNRGENWIGILAAAGIGFVFCVSVRLTGSAWWAIGCHAAWDWSETYFYGTPNSGLIARGHLLTTSPAGNPLLSGAADGPEGSLLVLGAIALLMAFLLVYDRLRSRGLFELSRPDRCRVNS